ncbi:hypothetical protein [Actinophytocola sp. KF-1]
MSDNPEILTNAAAAARLLALLRKPAHEPSDTNATDEERPLPDPAEEKP